MEQNEIKLAFYLALFIQKVQNTQLGFNEINTWLVVVKVNQCPGNILFHVLLLLQFKDMLQGGIAGNDLCVCFDYKINALSKKRHIPG